jgi:hypothetical protein
LQLIHLRVPLDDRGLIVWRFAERGPRREVVDGVLGRQGRLVDRLIRHGHPGALVGQLEHDGTQVELVAFAQPAALHGLAVELDSALAGDVNCLEVAPFDHSDLKVPR